MIHAGGARDFEFIYENAGNPRNEGADKLGGIPADSPHDVLGAADLRRERADGRVLVQRDHVLARRPRRGHLRLGQRADRPGGAVRPGADPSGRIVRLDPVRPGRADPAAAVAAARSSTSSTARRWASAWEVVRPDQLLTVSGGNLNIPAQPGDLYGGRNDAKNLTLRDMPGGAWEATAKMNFEGTAQYHQAGLIVYGDDSNFTKFGRIAHTTAGDEKFEFIYENAGTPRNEAADSTANIPAAFPDDFYVRMTSDGTNVTGAYSTDGTSWTPVGRPAPLPANARIGMFAFSNDGTGNPVAAFDSFTLTGDEVGGPAGPSRDDEFDGAALDKTRWNAIVREKPGSYTVAGRQPDDHDRARRHLLGRHEPAAEQLHPPVGRPRRRGLGDRDEARLGTVNGGYGQGGLIAYVERRQLRQARPDRRRRPDADQPHRAAHRGQRARRPAPGEPTRRSPAGTGTEFWLRLTKTGTSYSGEYSLDGTTWTHDRHRHERDGGSRRSASSPSARRPTARATPVAFDYFLLDGRDATEPCECVPTGGDEFDAGALDKTKWNAIVREQADLYSAQRRLARDRDGQRRHLHRRQPGHDQELHPPGPTEAGPGLGDRDTRRRAHDQRRLRAGRPAGLRDDDNYIKFDITLRRRADGPQPDRAALRGRRGHPATRPQLRRCRRARTEVWLRLTKTGTSYAGEYSFDGDE